MLRKVLIAVCIAGIAAMPVAAAPSARGGATQVSTQSLLMPGVSYQRQVEYTPHGPVVLDVVVDPHAIAVPSHIPFSAARGFTLSMAKEILHGRLDDVIETVTHNVGLL